MARRPHMHTFILWDTLNPVGRPPSTLLVPLNILGLNDPTAAAGPAREYSRSISRRFSACSAHLSLAAGLPTAKKSSDRGSSGATERPKTVPDRVACSSIRTRRHSPNRQCQLLRWLEVRKLRELYNNANNASIRILITTLIVVIISE